MRILAIETVETTGSVAALDGDRLLASFALDSRRRSAQTLAPGIQELLKSVGWQTRDVQLVAVASGPGSFTGLRIGVTTAKAFAYAVGCELIGVNTLAAIAAQAPPDVGQLSVVLDAQRGELFVADFRRGADGSQTGEDTTRIVHRESWLASLSDETVLSGPAVTSLETRLPAHVRTLPPELRMATAASVGLLGHRLYLAGQRDDVFELVPHYFRRTAAEEQWERKHAAR